MSRQRGVVLLLALTLSLVLGLLASMALREGVLLQRQLAEQLAVAQAFEQAESSLLEGAALLASGLPSPCVACRPPDLPDAQPPAPWLRTDSGFVFVQALGQSTRIAGMPPGDRLMLVRVTAVSRQVRVRQLLEAVYAVVDDSASMTRISWRQRLEGD
ncbi:MULTISPECIES: hypothetical protein [unclassified Pseudomonas]|uniref:hypothetical protein n=1 Tax=unclassified Pseudomonas TaxID=196821 RepID=UPI00244A86CB|nr:MULTISPECIES: hypothetical protein [unclassified Pseudomonas]MDH0304683.1 hypothetical protein [Pseudomonas sp. GD04091]MDH1986942.1 hypothetical protein [Pseudomonas sp. GD03689]